jgi:phosphate-selective porin OprO/OprP
MHKIKEKSVLLLLCFTLPVYASGFKSTEYELAGYIMLDHDYYGPFYDKQEKEYQHKTEVRRSKLSLSIKPNKQFKTKLQLKYSKSFPKEGKLALGDALVRMNLGGKFFLQVGKMKQPFGLEQQTSSSQLMSIERSLPSEAFSPGRDFGLQVEQKKKKGSWALGYFINRDNDNEFALSNFNLFNRQDNDIEMATGRFFTHSPFNQESKLHIGGSISKQWLNGKKVQFKETGEVNNSDTVIRSARFYADSQITAQAEMAWVDSHSVLQAEVFSTQLKAIDQVNWHYQGGYVQMSHHIFGQYLYKSGKIQSREKNTTSIELVIRQSYLDIRDHGVGSKTAISLLGANLHLKHNAKLMFNISKPWISGDTISNDNSGHSYSLRAQWSF